MEPLIANGAYIPTQTEQFINFLAAQQQAQLQYAELTRMNPVDEIKWPSAGPVQNYNTAQQGDTVLQSNTEYGQQCQLAASSVPPGSSITAMNTAVSGMSSLSVSNNDLCRASVVHSNHFLDNYDHFGAQYGAQQLLTPFLTPYFVREMDMNSLRHSEDMEHKSMSFPYTARGHGEEVLFNPTMFPYPVSFQMPNNCTFSHGEEVLFNPTMFPYPVSFQMPNNTKRNIKEEAFGRHPNEQGERSAIGAQATVTSTTRNALDCQVCNSTQANGLHFGARTCAACAAFFRRTISDDKKYVCKRSQRCNNPSKDGTGYRKICRACRLKRCMDIGMLPENVQHKRVPTDMPKSSSSLVEQLEGGCFGASHAVECRNFERIRYDARNALEASVPFDTMIPFYSHITNNNNNNNLE